MAIWLSELKLDCHKCSDAQKIERGCEENSPIHDVWKLGEWEFSRCPITIATNQSFEYIRAYIYREKGYLPNQGGWLDQPVKFIEAMEIIENELSKIRMEKEKENKGKCCQEKMLFHITLFF